MVQFRCLLSNCGRTPAFPFVIYQTAPLTASESPMDAFFRAKESGVSGRPSLAIRLLSTSEMVAPSRRGSIQETGLPSAEDPHLTYLRSLWAIQIQVRGFDTSAALANPKPKTFPLTRSCRFH